MTTQPFTPPPGAAQDQDGSWRMPNGEIVPGSPGSEIPEGVITPAMQQLINEGNDPRLQFDENGKPYSMLHGKKFYTAPAGLQASTDPRVIAWRQRYSEAPGQSFLHKRGSWNPETGEWDQGINWALIGSALAGGL